MVQPGSFRCSPCTVASLAQPPTILNSVKFVNASRCLRPASVSPCVNPPTNPDATREEVTAAETQPEFDLMADSMDRFILSLICEEAEPQRKKPRKDA